MYKSFHRRDFLRATGIVSVGSLGLRLLAADEPAQRGVAMGTRLLPGCCAYSYGSYLGKGKMTMEQFIVEAVNLGVLGVDILNAVEIMTLLLTPLGLAVRGMSRDLPLFYRH
jgi:hypothetical protein